jgi:hypothetical protein
MVILESLIYFLFIGHVFFAYIFFSSSASNMRPANKCQYYLLSRYKILRVKTELITELKISVIKNVSARWHSSTGFKRRSVSSNVSTLSMSLFHSIRRLAFQVLPRRWPGIKKEVEN